MSVLNTLFPNFFKQVLSYETMDSNNEMRQTCNSILVKNNTFIEIDRGWEGIPESLVINLVLCLVSVPSG